MSRRLQNPAADRAAQNQNTIKSLLKLEANKICADCKRNKHPRWASWNLGVFICIRCSGIHRGMGTHVSRVKSVDLDSWTDEQLQSVLRWGNSRANKYWEAKLAPGHVPAEAKIENFIRTKYESKRWVMDGPMPDPATLDAEGDDDVPLNIVQEKAKLERSTSQRAVSQPTQQPTPQRRPAQNVDLFGDDETPSPPIRPSTTDVPAIRSAQAQPPAPPKQTKPGDSLLGLDFFGGAQPGAVNRPTSAASNPLGSIGPSRPDLKQSILSLYASTPMPAQQSSPEHVRAPSIGGMQSQPQHQSQSSFGGLNDAFSGLSFSSNNTSQPQPASKPSAFANLTSFSSAKSPPAAPKMSSPPLSGGGFFDAPSSKPVAPLKPTSNPSNGLDFSFVQNATPAVAPTSSSTFKPTSTSSDLFDLSSSSSPSAPPPPPPSKVSSPPLISQQQPSISSAFNLSNPTQPAATTTKQAPSTSMFSSANMDAWGSTDAWSTPDPAPSAPTTISSQPSHRPKAPSISNDFSSGWGSPPSTHTTSTSKPGPAPIVSADEDFGGWNSAGPVSSPTAQESTSGFSMTMPANPMPGMLLSNPNQGQANSKKTTGGFGGDDLFSNVWE